MVGRKTQMCNSLCRSWVIFLTVDIQLIGILWGNSNPTYPNASVECSLLGAPCAYKACERAAETRLCGVQSFRTSAYWIVNGCGWALSTDLVSPWWCWRRVLQLRWTIRKRRRLQVWCSLMVLDLWILLWVFFFFFSYVCVCTLAYVSLHPLVCTITTVQLSAERRTCRILGHFKSK